jgi:hypothetical protein
VIRHKRKHPDGQEDAPARPDLFSQMINAIFLQPKRFQYIIGREACPNHPQSKEVKMKAKTLTVISVLAALALLLSGPATASVGATPAVVPVGQGQAWLLPVAAQQQAQQAQNVEFVAQIGGATYAVAVQGNYAYIGLGPRLVILNVSDRAHPALVGQTGVLPGLVNDMAVTGSYAYVATGDGGLRIINISDPAHPTEVGFYDTSGYAQGVVVSGDYAYVADGSGLRIIRVSDPAHPQEISFLYTGYALDVAISGNYAYIAGGYGYGLRIINVADPSNPQQVGLCYTPGELQGVAVSGPYAYVADGSKGLGVIDVSTPGQSSAGWFT